MVPITYTRITDISYLNILAAYVSGAASELDLIPGTGLTDYFHFGILKKISNLAILVPAPERTYNALAVTVPVLVFCPCEEPPDDSFTYWPLTYPVPFPYFILYQEPTFSRISTWALFLRLPIIL